MPKGSVPRKPGAYTPQRLANEAALRKSSVGKKRIAKAVNEWNEYRAAGTDTAGHATKSLRKSMRDVRSSASTGGSLARINENPVKALQRRAATKKK